MKKKIDDEILEKNKVVLKPIFGIHPVIVFFIKILFVFLLIGIIPSLFCQSRRVYITTSSYPVRLVIDSKDAGITPTNIRLSPGEHKIIFSYADKILSERKIKVSPALFFSYLFEYSQKVSENIEITPDLVECANKEILDSANSYSYLFTTDDVHTQKPYFSYYKSFLKDKCNENVLLLCKKFISNETIAEDFEKAFNKNANFKPQGKNLIDEYALKDENIINSKWQIIDIGKIKFVKVSDNLALSRDIIGVNANWKRAKEYCEDFSKKHSVRARLLSANEYYNIALCAYSDIDKKNIFNNFPHVYNEITSTIFTPSGVRLSSDEEKILQKYNIKVNYRVFADSKTAPSALSIDEKCRLFAPLLPDDSFEQVAFRIAVDLK